MKQFKYQNMLEHISMPCIVLRVEEKKEKPIMEYIYVNQAFRELVGKVGETFIGKKYGDIFPQMVTDEVLGIAYECAYEEKSGRALVDSIKDGKKLEYVANPIGEKGYVFFTITDITNDMKHEQEQHEKVSQDAFIQIAFENSNVYHFTYLVDENKVIVPKRTQELLHCDSEYENLPGSFQNIYVEKEFHTEFSEMFAKCQAGEKSSVCYFKMNNSDKWLRQTLEIIERDVDGAPLVALGIIEDQTEVRDTPERQRQLKDFERQGMQLRKALSSSAMVYYDFNLTKDLLYGEPKQMDAGKEIDVLKAIGMPHNCKFSDFVAFWRERVKEEDKDKFDDFFNFHTIENNFKKGKLETKVKYQVLDVTGELIHAEQTILLTKDSLVDEIIGFTYVYDLTEEMNHQKRLEEALEMAQQANKAKSTFLFNMSHDIRTPLNAITGFTELARRRMDDKKALEDALNKIDMSGNILVRLINDILDLARIENGKLQPEISKCDLYSFKGMAKTLFEKSMKDAGLKLVIESDVKDRYVYCDSQHMNQICINLLSNAQKFTPSGGTVLYKITQLTPIYYGYATYEFRIKDNGIGMSREFQERLFTAFERERTSTESGIQGTGLGLAIVKNLVDILDGTIECKSQLGVGTEFIIEMRLKIVEEMQTQYVQLKKQAKRKREEIRGKRVLLVEDNELNREIVKVILEDEGLLVEEAEDGMEAVDMVSKSTAGYYNLILMDIQMPKMDGYKATQEIRSLKDKKIANIPIVAMTANAFEEDRKRALKAGMNGHLAKPITQEVFFDMLMQIL